MSVAFLPLSPLFPIRRSRLTPAPSPPAAPFLPGVCARPRRVALCSARGCILSAAPATASVRHDLPFDSPPQPTTAASLSQPHNQRGHQVSGGANPPLCFARFAVPSPLQFSVYATCVQISSASMYHVCYNTSLSVSHQRQQVRERLAAPGVGGQEVVARLLGQRRQRQRLRVCMHAASLVAVCVLACMTYGGA